MSDPLVPERAITLLHADDEQDQRSLVDAILRKASWAEYTLTSVADGRSALTALRGHPFDVALLDLSMPGLDGLEVLEALRDDPARPEIIFISGRGTVAAATQAMKLGAYDFLEKPVDPYRLRALVWKAAEVRRVRSRSERLQTVAGREVGSGDIVTQDQRLERLLDVIARVAISDASVLIIGESGTGKELIARRLHCLSQRSTEPLVALNCAAVSDALAESELFGHERGAFTGALSRKMGLVELADGGTLFLDEIGDLSLDLQAKLLRVLESKSFRRVGGLKECPADFRLVSATNQPLGRMAEKGRFRSDLHYRINTIVVELPPLRERPKDISLLSEHFLRELRAEPWTIAREARELLEAYPWPGNVRELRNVIQRAVLLAEGTTILASDLGLALGGPGTLNSEGDQRLPTMDLGTLERLAIEHALHATGGHQGRAAQALGVSTRTLRRRMKELEPREDGLEQPD